MIRPRDSPQQIPRFRPRSHGHRRRRRRRERSHDSCDPTEEGSGVGRDDGDGDIGETAEGVGREGLVGLLDARTDVRGRDAREFADSVREATEVGALRLRSIRAKRGGRRRRTCRRTSARVAVMASIALPVAVGATSFPLPFLLVVFAARDPTSPDSRD